MGKAETGDGQTVFDEQCVQMSAELETSPSKHDSSQANSEQGNRSQVERAGKHDTSAISIMGTEG